MVRPIRLQESPIASFDLDAVADTLKGEKAFQTSRHTAASLIKGDDLRVVLTVAMKGGTLREHAAPRPAVVVVLAGEIVVRFPGTDEEKLVSTGGAVAFDAGVRHAVEAIEDARFLIVIGGHRRARFPESKSSPFVEPSSS